MKLLAPAKINLFLEVLKKRHDGYHEICSVMQTVPLFDEISIQKSPLMAFQCDWSNVGSPGIKPDENIAYKAAHRLKELLNEKKGAQIIITKHIPCGAGLGGGSSDAAAVLKGLLKLWKRALPGEVLDTLALSLGADVPFFIKGGCALAQGIGEKLTPLGPDWTGKPLNLILVKPDFSTVTKEIYAGLNIKGVKKPKNSNILKAGRIRFDDIVFVNDLEKVVARKHPEIRQIKTKLENAGAIHTLMSGSGSTVYGIFDNITHSKQAFLKIKKYTTSWLLNSISSL